MQSTQSPQKDDSGKQMGNMAKFTGIAFQMVVIIGVFAYAGYKIDMAAGHQTQWVTALMSLIGVAISLVLIFKSLKN